MRNGLAHVKVKAMRSLVVVLVVGFPSVSFAIDLHLSTTSSAGSNAVVQPAGTYGSPVTGWDELPGGNIGAYISAE